VLPPASLGFALASGVWLLGVDVDMNVFAGALYTRVTNMAGHI